MLAGRNVALSHAALSDGTTFFGAFKKFKSKAWLGSRWRRTTPTIT